VAVPLTDQMPFLSANQQHQSIKEFKTTLAASIQYTTLIWWFCTLHSAFVSAIMKLPSDFLLLDVVPFLSQVHVYLPQNI